MLAECCINAGPAGPALIQHSASVICRFTIFVFSADKRGMASRDTSLWPQNLFNWHLKMLTSLTQIVWFTEIRLREKPEALVNRLSPHDELEHHFTSLHETELIFPQFRRQISMKLFYQRWQFAWFFTHFRSSLSTIQVENCDSNSRLVVDKDLKRFLILTSQRIDVFLILTRQQIDCGDDLSLCFTTFAVSAEW